MIIGTAGHIDHGKTALVRALTGVDTDRLPEERRRGISIELGFAPILLDGIGTVGFVDVPGHEAFVKTMVAGAAGVDVALLTVAADEGVMPQTREHLSILELLGIKSLVVAITKADLVDEGMLELAREDVLGHLAETRFRGAEVVVTSARTGSGLSELRAVLSKALKAAVPRPKDDLFRLHVDRSFTLKGTGTVVTGTVWSGRLSEGDSVRIHPLDRVVRVRALQRHGAQVPSVGPGERAAVALASVEVDEAPRGSQLVSPHPWPTSAVIHAHVFRSPGQHEWRPRERLRFHVGTSEAEARVVIPARSASNQEGPARVVLDRALLLRAGDHFVLRQPSFQQATVGGGIVTDPAPFKRRSRPVIHKDSTLSERLLILLAEAVSHGLSRLDLPVRLGILPGAVDDLLRDNEKAITAGDRIYLKQFLEDAAQRVVTKVVSFHTSNPLEVGVPLHAVRTLLGGSDLAELVIGQLEKSGKLRVSGGVVMMPDFKPKAGGRDAQDRDALRERLRSAGKEPPSVSELREEIGGRDPLPILRMMEREGVLVQVEQERYFDTEAVAGMMQEMRAGMRNGEVYAPAQLREMLGISRKFLMPFLEYCDRIRFTERLAQGRVLGSGKQGERFS